MLCVIIVCSTKNMKIIFLQLAVQMDVPHMGHGKLRGVVRKVTVVAIAERHPKRHYKLNV